LADNSILSSQFEASKIPNYQRICGAHFEDKEFYNPFDKRRLNHMVIPTIKSQQLISTALININSDHNYSSTFSTAIPNSDHTPFSEDSHQDLLPDDSMPLITIQKVSNSKRR